MTDGDDITDDPGDKGANMGDEEPDLGPPSGQSAPNQRGEAEREIRDQVGDPNGRGPDTVGARPLDGRRPSDDVTDGSEGPLGYNPKTSQKIAGGEGRSEHEIVELRAKIIELRTAGYSFRQIAKAVDRSVAVVHRHYNWAVAELEKETIGEVGKMRALGMRRLERMISRLWPKAMPKPPPDGSPPDVDLESMRLLKDVVGQHAQLGGYNAPQRAELSIDVVQLTVQRVVEIVGRHVPDEQVPELMKEIEREMQNIHAQNSQSMMIEGVSV